MQITHMIEGQLQPSGIRDKALLAAIKNTPREAFVPQNHVSIAYADAPIPLPNGYTLWTPLDGARVLQALQLQETDTITFIGASSGYLAALADTLAGEVRIIEPNGEHVATLRQRFADLGRSIQCIEGNAFEHMDKTDVVITMGALPSFDCKWLQALNADGRWFAFVGSHPIHTATIFSKQGNATALFESFYPYLPGVSDDTFVF